MSRIEKAIEKAATLRKESGSAQVPLPSPSKEAEVVPTPIDRAVAKAVENTSAAVKTQTAAPPEGGMSSIKTAMDTASLKPDHPLLIINHEPVSGGAEEYRKLKSVVFELTQQEQFQNTLLVTSTLPDAGKTLTAVNLALTMAKEYDHTVLLVDTDLRSPSVHKYFGIAPEKGLVHCLTENYPLEKALIRTGIGKLVLLPAGGTVADPAELLASNRMRDLVAELKARYVDRYVIFDSTPVLPFAEASTIGQMMDGILFCGARTQNPAYGTSGSAGNARIVQFVGDRL
ncbi:MAG: AAA family ATPase [Syntrophotaleaceae bacterium]